MMNRQKVLVINCGSSSIKFSVVSPDAGLHLMSGMAERLETRDAVLKWKLDERSDEKPLGEAGHQEAAEAIAALLDESDILSDGLQAVGHRVVHGGERFTGSALIDDSILEGIEACNHLAPLHNPANVVGIRLARKLFPDLPQVAVFDTAFHQSMPPRAFLYAVPYGLYEEQGVRRYGFHGTSHRFVTRQAAVLRGLQPGEGRWISAHLGNGCSAAAVVDGRSVDTSMGLTPLEGLVMGTRSGDVDPSLHEFLAGSLGWNLQRITSMLNKESGLLGLSGLSNDMRTLLEAADKGNERALLAVEVFCYRLAKSIAGLAVPLGKMDALVFTGGIGENSVAVRERVVNLLEILGIRLDPARNAVHGENHGGLISCDEGTAAMVVPTDEELMIARESMAILG